MWDTAESSTGTTGSRLLSHDRPCSSCGHAMHVYLPCSDSCSCTPQPTPGLAPVEASRSRLVTA